ncbi:hypothetical protein F1643_11305 [Azospirillum sp. INR13]|uniref:hypothetical protein n=1 Tax=Azospirillum sp. INR13 TaxID=2596919 RepID=UPI00189247EF|nr:hypothetical protein [Azospirillum sp. INR13]MBF5094985.1 hypothetical protein [Azospirillum sp. INR13]
MPFGGALRRSEFVALDRSDLAFRDRGVTVTIRRSKTYQQGTGVELAVYGSPRPAFDVAAALTIWPALRGEVPGPLFLQADGSGTTHPDRGRLAGQTVARIVKRPPTATPSSTTSCARPVTKAPTSPDATSVTPACGSATSTNWCSPRRR